MLNEIKGSSTVVDRAISGQGVWQESPLVGADALMKAHQGGSPKAFRLTERPFLELVNVRGDTRDAAFVRVLRDLGGLVVADMRAQRSHQHQRALKVMLDLGAIRLDPVNAVLREEHRGIREQRDRMEQVVNDNRLEDVELEVALRACD